MKTCSRLQQDPRSRSKAARAAAEEDPAVNEVSTCVPDFRIAHSFKTGCDVEVRLHLRSVVKMGKMAEMAEMAEMVGMAE